MTRDEAQRLQAILHDAALLGGNWRPADHELRLEIDPLRRCTDGTDPPNKRVTLRLLDVAAIAVVYESSRLEQRPSTLQLPAAVQVRSLAPWPWPVGDVEILVNSLTATETVSLAPTIDWLHGDLEAGATAGFRLALWLPRGSEDAEVFLWVAARGWAAADSEGPLDLETWSAQNAAWWQGWQAHWNERDDRDDDGPRLEDTIIPVGPSDAPDPHYTPPAEPAFLVEASGVPAPLVDALRDWFEAKLAGDWARLVAVAPNLEVPPAERVEVYRRGYEADGWGRWGYARDIERWWIDGPHAFAQVRGIEHSAPVDEYEAENLESVWGVRLRLREGRWCVHSHSQGWPAYGSAEAAPPADKPWLALWRSGPVKSVR